VAVQGPDVVFKDIVEPLESVSVTIANTEKKDITEYGNIEEVRSLLRYAGWVRGMHVGTGVRAGGVLLVEPLPGGGSAGIGKRPSKEGLAAVAPVQGSLAAPPAPPAPGCSLRPKAPRVYKLSLATHP